MTELLGAASANNSQDHELEGLDFLKPVEVLGSKATESAIATPHLSKEQLDEPYEYYGFGD